MLDDHIYEENTLPRMSKETHKYTLYFFLLWLLDIEIFQCVVSSLISKMFQNSINANDLQTATVVRTTATREWK